MRVIEKHTAEYEAARKQWWDSLPDEARAEYEALMAQWMRWQVRYGLGALVVEWDRSPKRDTEA